MRAHSLLTALFALALPLVAQPLADSSFAMPAPPEPDFSTLSPEVRNRIFPTHPAAVPAAPAAPAAPSRLGRFSCDLRGFYGFCSASGDPCAADLWGMEAEFAYAFTPRQAITLSLSFGSGGNSDVNVMQTPEGPVPVSEDFTRSDFTLMLGYRFTQRLTEKTRLSFGIKGGLDVQHLSFDDYEAARRDEGHWEYDDVTGERVFVDGDHRYGETTCGLAYAASVTLTTRVGAHTQLLLGYQFRGATTEPDAPSTIPGGPVSAAGALHWHEIHLGARFVF